MKLYCILLQWRSKGGGGDPPGAAKFHLYLKIWKRGKYFEGKKIFVEKLFIGEGKRGAQI